MKPILLSRSLHKTIWKSICDFLKFFCPPLFEVLHRSSDQAFSFTQDGNVTFAFCCRMDPVLYFQASCIPCVFTSSLWQLRCGDAGLVICIQLQSQAGDSRRCSVDKEPSRRCIEERPLRPCRGTLLCVCSVLIREMGWEGVTGGCLKKMEDE